MDGLTGIQYYPKPNQTYVNRIQALINAYYDDTDGNPADDVERLSNQLSVLPNCINEYVDRLIVMDLSKDLPQDDIDYLIKKHDEKCRTAINHVRKTIVAIEKYSALMGLPHLFTKEETDDLTDENVLNLTVNIITDMYGEEQVDSDKYINSLKESHQKLDSSLLSLDYDD